MRATKEHKSWLHVSALEPNTQLLAPVRRHGASPKSFVVVTHEAFLFLPAVFQICSSSCDWYHNGRFILQRNFGHRLQVCCHFPIESSSSAIFLPVLLIARPPCEVSRMLELMFLAILFMASTTSSKGTMDSIPM